MIELSGEDARRAAVGAQLLDGRAPTTVTEVVQALGAVQVDPVASVARAERMVLFSRLGPYDVAELEAALARGELFEYWAHIVATSDYGIHREAMRRYPRGDLTRARYIREWVAANAAFRRYVLGELRRRGPLLSRDLEDRSTVPWRTGGWNDGKGVGRMLDILWFGGQITIVGREGNERVWDLAARRLPQNEPRWRPREVARAVMERGLRQLGVARPGQFGRMFDGVPPGAEAAWKSLVREGVAIPVRVDGLDGEWWAHRDVLGRDPGPGRTVLLSPFDRLVYDRERAAELFGFRYRLEMYVSPSKREYGYYVLPLLHDTELIGRVDATFERPASVLRVDGVWAERGAPADAGPDVAGALAELAEWIGADEVRVGRRVPESVGLRGSGRARGGRLVDGAEARRVAVRSQLLDGTATDVLETVRRLGFLQLDPIASVAPAQHLVLWSRLGPYDVTELDRLLWNERALFEWDAFVWPIEELPLVRGLMRRWRTSKHYKSERWVRDFLDENRAFRRYVLRELERRGPLLSRELEDRSRGAQEERRWYGSRNVGLMLTSLHLRGEVAIAGRAGGQRLWDLGGRVLPDTGALPLRDAERALEERRFRALGVRTAPGGWEAHPDALDGAVPDRVTFLSPFDRLIHDRDRAEALFGFHYRLEMFVPQAKRVYGYYVLPILRGTEIIGRIEPVFDRKRGTLRIEGVWAEPGAPADAGAAIRATTEELAAWLGAESVEIRGKVPRPWARALRA